MSSVETETATGEPRRREGGVEVVFTPLTPGQQDEGTDPEIVAIIAEHDFAGIAERIR